MSQEELKIDLVERVINHVASGEESRYKNIVSFHMDDISSIVAFMLKSLPGGYIDAHYLNFVFQDALTKLGIDFNKLGTSVSAKREVMSFCR